MVFLNELTRTYKGQPLAGETISIPTMFAYQGSLEEEIDFLDGRVTPESIQSDAPRFRIMAELFRAEGVYSLCQLWL